jgi:hypothetical protein
MSKHVHFCSSNVNSHDTAEANVDMVSLNLSVIVPNPRHISSAADIDARHQDFLKLDPNAPEHSQVQRFNLLSLHTYPAASSKA